MKIEINIRDSHVLIILLFITAASAMGLVVAYGGTAPATMGHSWGEMECAGCIINSNLADGSVTTAKIASNSVTGAKLGCDGILCKNPSGNVGIGTTTPTEKLDVAGNIEGTGLCIGSDCKTSWQFGGAFAVTHTGVCDPDSWGSASGKNPITGDCTCPAGFTAVKITTCNIVPQDRCGFVCIKA